MANALAGGWKYEDALAISIAAALAVQPQVHQRSSARLFDRHNTAKNTAISTDERVTPEMFSR